MAFTDAQRVDIRRFCGYEAYGAGASGFESWRFFAHYGELEYKLSNLDTNEETVVETIYLANLYTLETAIVNAGATLNIGSAAVFTRNKNEMKERNALFDGWRRRLCQFLGVPFGPGLSAGGNNLACVV